jgi:hypothetical protein
VQPKRGSERNQHSRRVERAIRGNNPLIAHRKSMTANVCMECKLQPLSQNPIPVYDPTQDTQTGIAANPNQAHVFNLVSAIWGLTIRTICTRRGL